MPSWASRAPLNDDRARIVAKLVEATFSSWACIWQPGGCFVVCWLVDSLYPPPNCGLERTSRFQRWHRPSKDPFRGVVGGVWRFLLFFFVRTTIIASLDGQQDVQCSKVRLLAGRSWPTTCKGPERLLRTSAVSELDVPATYHKCVSWVFKSLSRTVRMPQQSRCWHERWHLFLELVPRSAHLPSQWHTSSKSLERELCTTTLQSPSPSHPCSRRRDRRSKLRKARRTKHPNKESIEIAVAANLDP